MSLRVGYGVDVHAFTSGNHLVLGGVRIPFSMGLAAHSDGDVALHALCDAMLGAAALGDIGQHFPPGDEQWLGVDSRVLVRRVMQMLADQSWTVINVDLTVLCEVPRLAPHILEMRSNIAQDLALSVDAVSVKATTTEELGFCGRREGVAATATVLLAAPELASLVRPGNAD